MQNSFLKYAKLKDNKTVNLVSDKTREQSASSTWFEYRKGWSQKVNKLFKVATKSTGGRTLCVTDLQPIHLQSIGDITIRHCNKSFLKRMCSKHKKMEIRKCGVVLYNEIPIAAASPDALVTCSCHGVKPREEKNPFTHKISPSLSLPVNQVHVFRVQFLEK